MKVVECSGDPWELGTTTGEELRDEIREHIDIFVRRNAQDAWQDRLPLFLDALRTHLPLVLEEMRGTAAGAGVPDDDIFRLNLQTYRDKLSVDDACTNLVFADGPDGPTWGKNNDGWVPHRPVCARIVKPNRGMPQITFTFCGMIATTDGMNAEGVAVGHSSVGSIFQQSDRHPPIRLWAYEAMMHSRSTGDFCRRMTSTPLRGKGYSIVCVDREGTAVSLEAACPVVQIRRPSSPGGINCVNCYQSDELSDADQRKPGDKENALARAAALEIGRGMTPHDRAV